ncbi:ADP-ribose glycohydrolase ARH3 [Galendromus occidentalis]|uniref:ADP-ribosylhydrolase ARH3 n=1 Tax=Galendromus occidentalis TaxID=34638 RepID=A0AAJ6QXE5_9ACAR|nr:ADP-ribose glycohydrolase ARH3 [Galendromus occidentalis]
MPPWPSIIESMEIPRRRAISPRDDRETVYVDKYIGCLLGGLVGDCMGAPFDSNFDHPEGDDSFDKDVHTFLHNIRTNSVLPGPSAGRNHRASKGCPRGQYCYTDVTATTMELAKSLLCKGRFDARDVATRLTEQYFGNEQLDKEYGDAVRDIFRKWKQNRYQDIYGPANEQFGGMGSFGSGAAMRAAPVAILYKDDLDRMIETTILQAKMTHAHPTGICAAVLFNLAVWHALHAEPDVPLNGTTLLDTLIGKMEAIEEELDGFRPLTYKLHAARKLLLDSDPLNPSTIPKVLGNDMTAQGSVVTSIMCYILGEQFGKDIQVIKKTDNAFVRTLELALLCGGDADTLAAMACSLSGAKRGSKAIPAVILRQCQSAGTITKIAEAFAADSNFKLDL